jgi:antitoxin component of MazEF toxin-antitoxin module
MEIETKIRKWGNSYGVLLPKELLEKEKITKDSRVIITLTKPLLIKDIFGTLKGKKIDFMKLRNREREIEREKIELLSGLLRNHRNN